MLPFVLIAILETGWMPRVNIANYERNEPVVSDNTFYVKLGTDVSWKGFYINGAARIVVTKHPISWYEFIPVGLWSTMETGWRNDYINLGWRHECDHPVVVAYQTHPGIIKWEGGWDEIFARVTVRMQP